MSYDFDRLLERRGTASMKWDGMEKEYGRGDLLPMWVADMDFASPEPIVAALVARARHGVFGYTQYTEPVYRSIEAWMRERHGWAVEREWLAFSPGVVPGLAFLLKTFTDPGDGVIIQPPVYYPFAKVIELNGRTVVHNPLVRDGGRYRMDLDDLREKARQGARALILCSPHNPVGRVWGREELTALGDVCNEFGVLVVSDEVHSDLVYPGVRHIPYASLGGAYARNGIVCMAPSKTFNLAGLQTSVLFIPDPERRARYERFIQESFLWLGNTFGLTALQAAYDHGAGWLDELRNYLAENLAFLEAYIAREIPEIGVVRPEGTYLVWLDCRGLGMGAEDLAAFMRSEAHVALDDGHIFGAGGEGYERINIACPRSMLTEALTRIRDAVRARAA